MKAFALLAGSACLLLAISCNRKDEAPVPAVQPYGFQVDSVRYAVDSLIRDTAGPGSTARFYTSGGSGGILELKVPVENWPGNDTTMAFGVTQPSPKSDGLSVTGRFIPSDPASPEVMLVSHNAITAGICFVLDGGKYRAVLATQPGRSSAGRHSISIYYQEP